MTPQSDNARWVYLQANAHRSDVQCRTLFADPDSLSSMARAGHTSKPMPTAPTFRNRFVKRFGQEAPGDTGRRGDSHPPDPQDTPTVIEKRARHDWVRGTPTRRVGAAPER
jgi:hypothetical protein